MQLREQTLGILEDMLAAPDLVDPASIEVRPYRGRFAVFANGKLLKADFATQPLAHMWLHRHLRGNDQIGAGGGDGRSRSQSRRRQR
jgi:hypothetical protein